MPKAGKPVASILPHLKEVNLRQADRELTVYMQWQWDDIA